MPLAALLAVACGGNGSSPTPTPTPSPSPAVVLPSPTPEAMRTPTPEPAVETLAFVRDGDIWLIDADGRNERRLGLSGVLSYLWVSADEIDVVARTDRPMHLLVDMNGNVRELFFPGDFDVSGGLSSVHARGSWSRDGSLFAVAVGEELVVYDRSGAQVVRMEVIPPPVTHDPTGITTFCDEPSEKTPGSDRLLGSPVFTPDGQDVLVAVFCGADRLSDGSLSFPRNTYSRLYRVSLDTGAVQALVLSTNLRSDSRPGLSPDGSRIALPGSGYLSLCSYTFDLSVADARGAELADLAFPELEEVFQQADFTELGGGIIGGIVGYDWSPASDAVVVNVDVSVCKDFTPQSALASLYILKLDGSPPEKLVEGPAQSPAWSPSGRFIAYIGQGFFSGSSEGPVIRLLDLTTRQVVDLVQGSQPAWQPQP